MKLFFKKVDRVLILILLVISILLILVVITRASNLEDKTYIGETDNWKVTYELKDINLSAKGKDKFDNSELHILLEYKGNLNDDIRKVYVIDVKSKVGREVIDGMISNKIRLGGSPELFYWNSLNSDTYNIRIEWEYTDKYYQEELTIKIE